MKRYKSTFEPVFPLIIIVLLISMSIFSVLPFVPVQADEENWLTGWTYRKSHNITGSSEGAQTDYPIKIKVYREIGEDSGETVYIENKSKPDLGDIMFTASDGITPLTFREQIENGTFIEDKQDISVNATRYQAFPSIVKCSNGDLLIAYRDAVSHADNNARTITRRSIDNGVTWGAEVEVYDNLTNDDRDPQLHVAPNGTLILFVPLMRDNGGYTWLGIKYALSHDDGVTFGDWSDFPNDGPNRSMTISSHLINLENIIYCVANTLPDGLQPGAGSVLYKSEDNGASWEKVSVIDSALSDKTCETALTWIENDERFLTVHRDPGGAKTWKKISTNAEGTAWGELIDITSQVGVFHDPELTWFGTDLLILAGRDKPNTQTIYYESYDDGDTFVNRTMIDDFASHPHGGYTSTVVLNSTTALITFYTDVPNTNYPDIRSVILKKEPNIFWVELDAIPADPDNATIYLYYGNSEATSASTDMREDFTDELYVEVDPNSHIEVTATRITSVGLNRNEEAYVYKDLGAEYSGDHALLFNFVRTSGDGGYILHAGFGDEIDDASQEDITLFLSGVSVADLKVYLKVVTGGVADQLTWEDGSLETVYYGVIKKYGNNTFLGIYSDAARTNVLASSNKTDLSTHRYIYGVSSHYTGSDKPAAGYTENFFLMKYVYPEPTHGDWGAEEEEGGTSPPPSGESMNAQDIFLQCEDEATPYGYEGTHNGAESIENYIRGSVVNHTNLWGYESSWNFNVTKTRFYINGGSGTLNARSAVYEFIAYNDAGELYGITAEETMSSTQEWKDFYPDNPITLPDGDPPQYFITIWAGSGTDTWELSYDNNAGLGEKLWKSVAYGSYPDPLTGETGDQTADHKVRGRITAFTTNQTAYNQYWGTASDYTARRDISVTFPTGIENREINMTLPNTENLLNITYSNGGFWNASLSSSDYAEHDYNETHKLIQIPEATIAAYGKDYRVFTETYDYYGTLTGPFYENGTAYPSSVSVTMASSNGTETIVVDGTDYEWGSNDQVFMFYWSLQSGGVRRVYVNELGETITVYMPEDDYATYEFEIRDYTGRLDAESFLEAWRVVNSTEALIERSSIIDAINDVPLSLVQYAVYNLRVVFGDGTTYVFGYLVTGVDPTPTISIHVIEWGSQAHTTYTHITVEATRPTTTSILASYLDETPGAFTTSWVNLTITYRDGTEVYNASQADSKTVSFSWPSANATLDYVVRVTATHSYYGTISGVWVLDASRSFSAFPNLDALGSWGFDTTNLLAFGVSIIVAACFSFAGRWLAPFAFMSTVGAFTYLGATDLSSTQVGIGFVLAIIMGALMGGRDQ